MPQVGAILRSIAHACSAHADPTLNFYQGPSAGPSYVCRSSISADARAFAVENAPYSHPVRELRSAGFEPIAISSRNKECV